MNPKLQYPNSQLPQPRNRHNVLFVICLVVFFSLIAASLLYKPSSTRQQQDINGVAAVLQEAYDTNTGTVSIKQGKAMNELDICTDNCLRDNNPVQLVYYTNQQIFFHSYTPKLMVPNANIAYIVDDTNCNNTRNGLGSHSTNPNSDHAQAILYAIVNGNKLTRKCDNIFGANP
jgi:hypothetical protein